MKDFPRRNQLDQMSAAELAIYGAVQEIEKAGCDVRLTDAQNLLHAAQEQVADFVDNQILLEQGVEPEAAKAKCSHLSPLVRLTMAMSLLRRANDQLSEHPPDDDWFREFFILTGEHVVRTDEGWTPGSEKEDLVKEYGEKVILEELNAPCTHAQS